ncbi:methionyl-tRNA synthetase, partial [Chytriomyces hyalinus]
MLGRLTPRFLQRRHLHSNSKPVLITSPIFYVNAVPHIGHLYSAVLADTLKRWYALKGHEAMYSTGTDEHGLKIQEAARKAKQDPKEFCDAISHKFKTLFDSANVSYTRFIRTTDADHYAAVDGIWRKLVQNGYIYKGTHEGWYSISDETFYPATQVEAVKDAKTGLETMMSKESRKPVEWTVEENYKFRLGDLKNRLVEWLEANPDAILPKAQYLNILNTLKASGEESLGDISVSRPSSRLQWGIPVPDDPSHVIYVWLDALTNYLTVAGYPWPDSASQAKSAWPAQWHVVGKDIVKFHAIYWPAFLMAAELPLPKHIISHAHWLQGKTKMSKSLGNVTDPHALIEAFGGVDPVRYFLMRDGGIEYDADFSKDMVMKRYRELSNQLGNLALRCSGEKVNASQCIPPGPGKGGYGQSEEKLLLLLNQIRDRVTSTFENAQFSNGLESIITLVNEANGYWGDQKPWVLADQITSGGTEADEARERLQTALYLSFETMRVAGILLQPVMPSKMETLLSWMGVDSQHTCWDCAVLSGGEERNEAVRLSKLEPLFPKSKEQIGYLQPSRIISSSSHASSSYSASAPSVRELTPNQVRVIERSPYPSRRAKCLNFIQIKRVSFRFKLGRSKWRKMMRTSLTAMHWSELDGNLVTTGNAVGEVKIWDVGNITGGGIGKFESLPVCTFYVEAPRASDDQPAVKRADPVAIGKIEWAPHCKGILMATRADGTITLYNSSVCTPVFSSSWGQDAAHEGLIMSAANVTAEDTREATVQHMATVTTSAPVAAKKANELSFAALNALKRALGGGVSGAAAMVVQVFTLMPMRTIMNYQYKFGSDFKTATGTLYKEGGMVRYYRGLGPALIQGPLSRFGDTASNAGALALLESSTLTRDLPMGVKTLFASAFAACFRMVLTPVDTLKTTMQTKGTEGTALLRSRVKAHGVGTLWYGAGASAAATFVGHYPWFATYNMLQEYIPKQSTTGKKLARNAVIG